MGESLLPPAALDVGLGATLRARALREAEKDLEAGFRMADLQVVEVPSFSCSIFTIFSLKALTAFTGGLCQLLVSLLKKSSGSGIIPCSWYFLLKVPTFGEV